MTNPQHTRTIGFMTIFAMLAIATSLTSCGTTTTYSNPAWATGLNSTSPYYYFPNYDMYYDATTGQYYYLNNGAWLSSMAEPYPGVDLNNAYVVELNQNTQRPWVDNDFYQRNYPAHEEEEYERIARERNLVPNVPQNHVIVPRAYDENSQRMIFEERREARQAQPNERPGERPAPGPRITHEVPMRAIAPNMPAQARQYRYGGDQHGR